MKFFTQTTQHSINKAICSDFFEKLPEVIRKHSDLDYLLIHQCDKGCFLKPTFRNMPYWNSFVPEIDIVVSSDETHTVMYISGQPVRFVRVFMAFYFSFLLAMEVFLIHFVATFKPDSVFSVFIPVVMCVFGYFLYQITTKATFNSVIKAIKKEYA